MRINTNVPALNTQRILSQTNTAIARSIGRLSSRYRLNRAADDAAGLGIANQMRADLRAMNQAARNAEQASSALQIAEGAAQTIASILDRMKELAVQAASDNTSDDGRLKIQAEFALLQEEITRIVDTTKFQGKTLLDGSWGQGTPVTFMVSVSGNEGQNGLAGADDIELGTLDLRLETLGLDTHSLGTKADAQAAISAIDGAISMVSDAFGQIGAAQNRLDYALTNVRTAIENVSAAESTIRDADMAAEMTTFTRNQILQQTGMAMLAQANAAPQLVLRLLQ